MEIGIIVAGLFCSRWAENVAQRWLEKHKLEPQVRQLITRLVRLFVFFVFAIMALDQMGVEITPMLAGIGVGFSLADFSVVISIVPWVAIPDYFVTQTELNQAIIEQFAQKGISMPFPQQEVRLIGQGKYDRRKTARDETTPLSLLLIPPISEPSNDDRCAFFANGDNCPFIKKCIAL